jgi:D-lactate dehydrogenase
MQQKSFLTITASYKKKIGPDPASINACMIGGIIANNSSGMCCGVAQNSYHTMVDMKIVLADGTTLDTGNAEVFICNGQTNDIEP